MDFIGSVKSFLIDHLPVLGDDAAELANDTDDAALQSHSCALPSNPFAQASLTSSRPSTATHIDLAISPRRSRIDQQNRRSDTDRSRPALKKGRSDDEKRLVGDFDVPADRVYAPNPASYFQTVQPVRAAMVKPGSGQGFIPINTIDDVNRSSGGRRQVTYSKSSRQSIGRVPGLGQQEYDRLHGIRPATPAQKPPSRQELTSQSNDGPPPKRRKTENVSAPPFINLVGDDDVQEISGFSAPTNPAVRQHDLSRSSHSSQSRPSIGSGPTISASGPGSQPVSEFQMIEKMTRAKRTPGKPQTPSNQSRAHFGRSVSRSITPRLQDAPVHILEGEPVAPTVSVRKALLKDFKQGVSAECRHEATTSHHFPQARINESTSDIQDQKANTLNGSSTNKNLRRFRRADGPAAEADPISDDELQMEMLNDKAARSKRRRSPGKTSQVANSGVKRKVNNKADTSKGWPLIFARTDGFHYNGVELDDGRQDLSLVKRPEEWNIRVYDVKNGEFKTEVTILPRDVTAVQADDIGRIRLEGPRRQDGNRKIFDLEFVNAPELRIFRDQYAESWCAPRKLIRREETYMVSLFEKQLVKNERVGTFPLVHDTSPEAANHIKQEVKLFKTLAWNQMKASAQDKCKVTTNGNSHPSADVTTSSAPGRPSRSTRSSAPTYDVDDKTPDKEVEKYSVKHGLGQRWQRPLTYGEGRQKATVYFDDLPRLDEEEFMNDSLIDFYMIYLFDKSNIPKDKIFFFNTYFFTKLTQDTGRHSMNYKAVERWTSKVDIFSYDYIVVPINEQTHWYLAIICNVGNIDRKPVEEDFSDDVAEDLTKKDDSVQSEPGEATVPQLADKHQLVDVPQTSSPPKDAADEQADDINLFDEESKLDLIDRDETGSEEQERLVPANGSSVPPSPKAEVVHATHTITSQEVAVPTILSSLNASSGKKKSKRKPRVTKKDPTQPIIIILDSLSGPRSGAVRALKDWLAAEGEAKRGMVAIIKENGFYPKSEQIPTQSNWTDCGVYLLGYVARFFQNPDEFKNKLLTGEMTADEDWPQLKPKEMRNDLRNIIFEIATEQKLTEEKKKKGKKGAKLNKSSPTQPGASPKDLAPQDGTSEVPRPEPEPAEPVEEQAGELAMPQLGSPITFKPQIGRSLLGAKSPEVVAVIASRSKDTTTSPHLKQTPGKRTHPEVRIPVFKTSPSQGFLRNDNVEAGTEADASSDQARVSTQSASQKKRTRPAAEDDDQLQMPPRKNQTSESPSAKPNHISPSRNSLFARPKEGHSDCPIEIIDSQEIKPLSIQSPRRLQIGSPARQQLSRSPHKTQSLRHASYVEETPAPSPRVMQRKHRQQEEVVVGHQLEARLSEDDEAWKRRGRAAGRSRTPPTTLQPTDASDPELMDVDSQGIDPMDTADDAVGETPKVNRISSPLTDAIWVKGRELPY